MERTGDMSVDDVAVLAGDAELVQQHVADRFFFPEGIVGAFFLLLHRFVVDEAAFESRHPALVEERGILAFPKIPDVIHREVLLRAVVGIEIGGAHQLVHFIQQGFALIFRSFDPDRLERAVRVHRDGGRVEERVGVPDLIHAAVREQAAHVLFQFLATFERVLDAPHQFFFSDRKGIGVLGIESRPVLVFQLVFLSFDTDRPAAEVDMVEQQAVVHPEFRTAADDLAFQLELYDRDRLVHAGDQLGCLFIEGRIRRVRTRDEQFAGVVSIDFHGECRQGQEVDAIAVLNGCQVAVAHRHTRITLAMLPALPAAAPIQRMSWLPHWMSKLWELQKPCP